MGKPKCPRFSEYFAINKPQQELDFVDVLLTTDLPVYIDPYAFKVGSDDSAVVCNNLVVDFFETILDCIRTGRDYHGRRLLDNLNEPNETRLGVSSASPQGRGVGKLQAGQVYDKLAKSEAVKTGLLRDLSDCELLIPGISQDKISDITTNIIRGELAAFTSEQCFKHGVPLRRVPRGVAWLEDQHAWKNDSAFLPLFENSPIILIPRWMVRRKIAADHQEYYRDFVLTFLQQENLDTASGLVELLQNGKRRVTKKRLGEQYPCNKDWLREFSEKHKEVFERYREYLNDKLSEMNGSELEKFIRDVQQLHGGGPVILGDVVMGDKNTVHGNNNAGLVGSGTINARDITVYSEAVNNLGLDEATKRALITAREAVEAAGLSQTDKADVNDSLGRITVELEKKEREPGLIRRYFNRIKEVASGVASVLSSAKVIQEAIELAA
jgi:hypothetical protein